MYRCERMRDRWSCRVRHGSPALARPERWCGHQGRHIAQNRAQIGSNRIASHRIAWPPALLTSLHQTPSESESAEGGCRRRRRRRGRRGRRGRHHRRPPPIGRRRCARTGRRRRRPSATAAAARVLATGWAPLASTGRHRQRCSQGRGPARAQRSQPLWARPKKQNNCTSLTHRSGGSGSQVWFSGDGCPTDPRPHVAKTMFCPARTSWGQKQGRLRRRLLNLNRPS